MWWTRALSSRVSVASLAAIAAAATSISFDFARAEPGYPNRNITWVVGWGPAGPPDVLARILAPAIGEVLGTNIIIENKPGAGGTIAAGTVARVTPDGYTILSAEIGLIVSQYTLPSIPYEPFRDFKMVAKTATSAVSAVIDAKLPYKTPADVVAASKKDPNAIKAAHSGIGAPPHLGLLTFMQATGADLLVVPYKAIAAAMQDVVAGHISMLFSGPSTSLGLIGEGKVHMLALTGSKRLPELPNVPTFAEAGIDMGALRDGQYFGLAVPAGVPDSIVEKLNDAVNKALAKPAVRERLAKLTFEPAGGTAQEFTAFMREQGEYWKKALADTGIAKPK